MIKRVGKWCVTILLIATAPVWILPALLIATTIALVQSAHHALWGK